MRQELDNFIIESDINIPYFEEVVNHILINEKKLLEFFNLEHFNNKVTISLMSYEPFKTFIINKYGDIAPWTRGDSDYNTNTIRVVNIEDQIKYTSHKDADLEQLKDTILHEIVHSCQNEYHRDFRETIWFAEGLATNLSNQKYSIVSLEDCDFNTLKNNFHYYKGGYAYAYTIVNYILNNYPKEEVDRLYSDPDYLRANNDKLFAEALEYSRNHSIKR